MPDEQQTRRNDTPRGLPADMADRLIVALDVPEIAQARKLVSRLDGTVSFFKIGLWLAFAKGVDGLIGELVDAGKKVFLDAKMFDIGRTVQEGVARAADRGVSFVTVHGDAEIIRAAVQGKGDSELKILAVTVLTSLGDQGLWDLGFRLNAKDLVHLRVRDAVRYGCDGIIAAAHDNPNELRRAAAADQLLVVTPGIRSEEDPVDDHKRAATAGQAISDGADYLVVGRPIIANPDPAARARQIVREMRQANERLRRTG